MKVVASRYWHDVRRQLYGSLGLGGNLPRKLERPQRATTPSSIDPAYQDLLIHQFHGRKLPNPVRAKRHLP